MNTGRNKIGQGSYGTIYGSYHPTYGDVVIKEIDSSEGFNHPLELDILFSLDHPHLMKALDIRKTEINSVPYTNIIMERATSDLAQYVAKVCKIPYPNLVMIMHQCLSALKALHDNNIMHIDIKANNILYKSRDGQPYIWLTDFGLSRIIFPGMHSPKNPKIIEGFRPPENIDNNNYERHTDIWTMGMTFAHITAGFIPPDAHNWVRQRDVLLDKTVIRYTKDEQDKLRSLLRGMIEPNRKERQTCDQLLDHPIFEGMVITPGRRKITHIKYGSLPVTQGDKERFFKFWKFVNQPNLTPRTIANCVDIYHRYMAELETDPNIDNLELFKTLALCASLMIAAKINDDVKIKGFDLAKIFFGNVDLVKHTKLIYLYQGYVSVVCMNRISNAPFFDYVQLHGDKLSYSEFCKHLSDIHDPNKYKEIIQNSPKEPNQLHNGHCAILSYIFNILEKQHYQKCLTL